MTSLESIVCSLEWAKKLREAGWPQDSCFYRRETMRRGAKRWHRTLIDMCTKLYCEENPLPNPDAVLEEHIYSAPTAEEILRRLPIVIDGRYALQIMRGSRVQRGWAIYYESIMAGEDEWMFEKYNADSLANAAASMFCYLAEHKLLSPTQS